MHSHPGKHLGLVEVCWILHLLDTLACVPQLGRIRYQSTTVILYKLILVQEIDLAAPCY